MNWKAKALIQRTCAGVPVAGPYLYGILQQACGRLRENNPKDHLEGAALMVRELKNAGVNIVGGRVMEVGTGWDLNLSIGFYLCGVNEILEFDLHRTLISARVKKSLDFVRAQEDEIKRIFGDHAFPDRLRMLRTVRSTDELMQLFNLKYHAPADSTATPIRASSVDLHVSFTVFEHVSPEILHGILVEAARVLKPSGAACHQFDLSDHFSHTDPDLTYIDFLRYSKDEWSSIAGNRFAYHNRLRPADYRDIYRRAGHEVINWHENIDQRSLQVLRTGFPLHSDYANTSHEELAIYNLRIISRPSTAITKTLSPSN